MKQDESDPDDEFSNLIREAEKKKTGSKKKAPKKTTQGVQEELLALQRQQMELLKEQSESNKTFFTNMIKEQQRIETEEREKDREFFLKLGQAMFSSNK